MDNRTEELTILNSIAQALNSSVNIDEALKTALAKVAKLLGLQTGWVWLLHPDSEESYLAAAQDLPPALVENPEEMEGSCYCLDTFQMGDLEGAANVNVVSCSRLKWLRDGTHGLRYHASIPLYAYGKKLGVLNVASRDWRELTADELRMLHTIGDMLGIAVERARLFDRSVQLGAAEERNRLAREIHDTLAQELAGLTLQLESADALLEGQGDAAKVHQIVQNALAMARMSLEEVQRSVLDLRAAPLEGKSLVDALGDLAADSARQHQIQIRFTPTGAQRPLSARTEIGLYRIAQEGLRNVIQHAQAQHVQLNLLITPEHIRLVLEDDGRGFDTDEVPEQCFGLMGINERAKLLDGQLRLESALGEGTRLEVVIPH